MHALHFPQQQLAEELGIKQGSIPAVERRSGDSGAQLKDTE